MQKQEEQENNKDKKIRPYKGSEEPAVQELVCGSQKGQDY